MNSRRHIRTLQTAAVYFALVFGTGFVLGAVRVLLLEPYAGTRAATLMEIPVMLLAIFAVARRIVRKRAALLTSGQYLAAGLLAAMGVLGADIGVGIFVRKMPAGEIFRHGDPVAAAAYYLALVIFATALWITSQAVKPRRANS